MPKKQKAKAVKPAKKVVSKPAKKVSAKPAVKAAKPVKKTSAKPAAKPAKKVETKAKPAAKAAKPVKKVEAKTAPKPAAKVAAPAKAKDKVETKAAPKPEVKAPKIKAPKEEVQAPVKVAPKIELKEVIITDAEGRRLCKVTECDQPSIVEMYCRYHYLLFWKKIQIRRKILSEGKLEKYIEELTSRYPTKYLELLKKDLSSEAEFMAAIGELEIDESAGEGDGEFEDDQQNYIEEVSGIPERDTSTDTDQDSY